ncbi:YtpR family tRNA-binding protein [Staphylococcus massiliensis]|uniref:tRNA-binding domain-containing protein n=1 Tax=Staphylococcus massiliensis S46 TaxID=1229783 RepID=K9AS51_9STAP|nr:DUF4479 family protein [Staphylococcus massiliensis]EKU50253.1 hypothetical protein C273_01385 [Staphylococcus massiliensis S46]MCG3399721.1 DUF4479 domain-containing protein [Staphylococcus massiliensis]MCG3400826.1 DUF4479 domain-containing protein [Staphylococcus massiliensis]MCG3412010.1 DUF4479 domain-containing protein [Staphylococcus massiliensis]
MNIFYNKEAVGDVLFLQIEPVEGPFDYEKKGNVVKITKDNDVVGFNIFDASNTMTIEGNGHIKVTSDLVDASRKAIKDAGFDYELDVDLSPKFVVGYVMEKDKHPNADKLSVLKIDVETEQLQIVCGAPNVDQGQKVVIAKVGAVMPSGMVIKEAELRGVPSYGMVCSMKELDLPNAPKEKGIMVLSDDYTVGQPFFEE